MKNMTIFSRISNNCQWLNGIEVIEVKVRDVSELRREAVNRSFDSILEQ